MDSIDQLGKPLISYEGIANFKVEERNTRIESKGPFKAAQFSSGGMIVNVQPTDYVLPTRMDISIGDNHDPDWNLSFAGQDADGWTIEPSGQKFFSRLYWLLAPFSTPPPELSFRAQYINARREGRAKNAYSKARFLASNLIWHHDTTTEPEPIQLKAQGFAIVINPIDRYQEITERLTIMHGVEPTALIDIESPTGQNLPIEIFSEFMDLLIYVFRLVTGNSVNWYYGEVFEDNTGNAVEIIHHYVSNSTYSNTIRFRPLRSNQRSAIPKLNLPELTEAFFNTFEKSPDPYNLKALINYFISSCDSTSYLQLRGLLASTLIDLMVAKHAKEKGQHDFIPHQKFQDETLPALKSAVEKTNLPPETQQHIMRHLNGAYSSTFRQRLRSLVKDFDLGLSSQERGQIVDTRNNLVHEGTYKSKFEDGGWSNDYRLITWTNFAILCRLLGYEGELPEYQDHQQLEI